MFMLQVYDDHGIRFEYPRGWDLEVTEDGSRTTVAVNAANGLAFALVTADNSGVADPNELAAEALQALKDEYSGLEARPSHDKLDGHSSVGYDVEFISLDLTNSCTIRSIRTPRRTLFYFAQWTDLDGEFDHEKELLELRRSLEETDA
jgi:hypothetical protein